MHGVDAPLGGATLYQRQMGDWMKTPVLRWGVCPTWFSEGLWWDAAPVVYSLPK